MLTEKEKMQSDKIKKIINEVRTECKNEIKKKVKRSRTYKVSIFFNKREKEILKELITKNNIKNISTLIRNLIFEYYKYKQ